MKLLPSEHLSSYSRLTPEQIHARLDENTTKPSEEKILTRPDTLFRGTISSNDFSIIRTLNYRNSFVPLIEGNFMASGSGSDVHVKFKLHPVIIAFMSVFFLFGLAFLAFGLFYYFSGNDSGKFALMGLGFVLFAPALVLFGFKFELKKSKEALTKLLELRL